MDKRYCKEMCDMKIWLPVLCEWCKEASCPERRMIPLSALKEITNRNSRFYKIKEKK